jgi:hypothetical protein
MKQSASTKDMLMRLKEEIRTAAVDVKAEAVLLMAIEKGIPVESFMINNIGTFRRDYGKDISDAVVTEDKNKREYLELHLNRDSIFDKLPEGLFFQPSLARGKNNSTAQMVTDHKENLKLEKEIRKFFLPYEHEFFLQKLQLEEQENLLLEGLQTGILNEYFKKFWNLPETIPSHLLTPVIILLPYAHKISADLNLMKEAFKEILREQVELVTGNYGRSTASVDMGLQLGDGILGIDSVLGKDFWDGDLYIEIIVGPLRRSTVTEFLPGGSKAALVDIFNSFFMQAGIDTKLTIIPNEGTDRFSLGTSQGSVLGVSTLL